jgi:hypothetical protein
MNALSLPTDGLFPAQPSRCTVGKGVSDLWAPIGWYPDPDRRKRLPSRKIASKRCQGGVKGALRTVGSWSQQRNALMPGGERPRETAHVQTIIEEKRERGDI